jgi:phage terminase large subunit
MLYGDWDIFEGQYFSEFNREIHTCKPFEVPKHWRVYIVFDYGLDMLAAYQIAVDEQGRGYVTNEVYESDLIVSEAAKKMKEVLGDASIWLAPPDLWNRRQETGKSVADIFSEHGISLTKSNNERVNGWMAVKEWLNPFKDVDEVTRARLTIFDNCKNLIRTLPAVQYDDKNPNDVAKEPHELTHAPDAIRYFCVYWTTAAQKSAKTGTYTKDMLEDWYNSDEEMKKLMEGKYGRPY